MPPITYLLHTPIFSTAWRPQDRPEQNTERMHGSVRLPKRQSKPALYHQKEDAERFFSETFGTVCYGMEVIPMKNNIVPIVRRDGLTIFEDANDPVLNEIRRHGTRRQVILAVALRRFQQVALNYSAKWAPDLYDSLKQAVDHKALPLTDGVLAMLPRTAEAPDRQEEPLRLGEAVIVT